MTIKEKRKKFLEQAITKMLSIAGYSETYQDVVKDEEWLQKYSMTTDEFDIWEKWFKEKVKKKKLVSKYRIDTEFNWFNLNYGLRINDLNT